MALETEAEELYTAPIQPDPSNTLDVFAFLLVPERVFYTPADGPGVREAVREVLHEAKRDVLLQWFAITGGRR